MGQNATIVHAISSDGEAGLYVSHDVKISVLLENRVVVVQINHKYKDNRSRTSKSFTLARSACYTLDTQR